MGLEQEPNEVKNALPADAVAMHSKISALQNGVAAQVSQAHALATADAAAEASSCSSIRHHRLVPPLKPFFNGILMKTCYVGEEQPVLQQIKTLAWLKALESGQHIAPGILPDSGLLQVTTSGESCLSEHKRRAR